jgi:hypothetical protein
MSDVIFIIGCICVGIGIGALLAWIIDGMP